MGAAVVAGIAVIIGVLVLPVLLAGALGGDGETDGEAPGGLALDEVPTAFAPVPTATPQVTSIALESSALIEQSGRITVLGPEGWSSLELPEQVGYTLLDAAIDEQGRLYALGREGVGVLDGSQWVIHPLEAFLPQAIALDSHGQVWVADLLGVRVLRETDWVTYEFPMGRSFEVNDLVVDQQDRVWAATESGLVVLDGARWTQHELGLETSFGWEEGVPVDAVAVGQDGRIWAGNRDGVSIFDGQIWITYGRLQDVDVPDLSFVEDLAIDTEGTVWAGTSDGAYGGQLWAFGDGSWTEYDRSNSGLLGGEVRAIATDGRGRLWVGTDDVLTVFDGTGWVTYTSATSGLDAGHVERITIPGDGPAALPEPEGPGVGKVAGRVTLNGEPLAGAEVHVCWVVYTGAVLTGFSGETPCGGEEYVAITDPDGRFSLENIPMGWYGFVTRTPHDEWYIYGETQFPSVIPGVHFFLDSGKTHLLGLIKLGDE